MGVMACERNKCDNVCCQFSVISEKLDYHMYICRDCVSELRQWAESWPPTIRKRDVESLVMSFMGTLSGFWKVKPRRRGPSHA